MTIGLLIPVEFDDPVRRVDFGGLRAMQELVGGNIENVPYPPDGRVSIFIDDEGKYDGAEVNPRATALCGPYLFAGDDIRGPVLVCGFGPETGENVDLPQGWEDEHLGRRLELPEADEIERGSRSISYRWKLRTEDEKTVYAVLFCGHSKAGVNMFSGRQHGSEFYATLRSQQEESTPWGKSCGFTLGDGVGIRQKETNRFSQKGLEEFAHSALVSLAAYYAVSNPKVMGYFRAQHGAPLGAVS